MPCRAIARTIAVVIISAPPEERFKGMGCEGAMINSEQEWWADQDCPAYKGPRLVLKGRNEQHNRTSAE